MKTPSHLLNIQYYESIEGMYIHNPKFQSIKVLVLRDIMKICRKKSTKDVKKIYFAL